MKKGEAPKSETRKWWRLFISELTKIRQCLKSRFQVSTSTSPHRGSVKFEQNNLRHITQAAKVQLLSKPWGRLHQIFVAFSEKLNFTRCYIKQSGARKCETWGKYVMRNCTLNSVNSCLLGVSNMNNAWFKV